jgi:hypothetical protein
MPALNVRSLYSEPSSSQRFSVPVPAEELKALILHPSQEITAGDKDAFMREYLAPLAEAFTLQGEGISSEEFSAAPVPRLFLDDTLHGVKLRFRFAYGQWEYPRAPSGTNPVRLEVDPATSVLYRVMRDLTAETDALQTLSDFGVVPSPAEHVRVGQTVVNNDVRALYALFCAQCNQAQVTWPGTNQKDFTCSLSSH